MNMSGEQRIDAPRQRVWEALNDPNILRASIPGCLSLEKETDDRFAATVEVKVGPIGARFKGAVGLTNPDPPNGYTLNLQGNGGITGSVKGNAKVRLREDAGATLIAYDVDAEVSGRMAQLGGPIIDATAKQLAGKFFTRFGEIVGGAAPAAQSKRGAANEFLIASAARASAAPAAAGHSPAIAGHSPAVARHLPMVWILATVVAALAGFLLGRSPDSAVSDWAGLAIALMLIVVAGAAFEYGRRSAAPVIKLDDALLKRLIERAKE
jgi:carbon monoxide dehydrogenase subunit G